MILHQKIRKLRLFHDLKQEYMAAKLEVSVRTYGKYESGQGAIPPEKLAAIAAIFDLPEDYLKLSDEIEMPFQTAATLEKTDEHATVDREKSLYDRLIKEKEAVIRRQDKEIRFLKSLLQGLQPK
jgi:transcriptional regulator with XRE-family HTH domain